MAIIKSKTINEVRKTIDKSKEKSIIVQARDENFNRKVLENKKVNILLNPGNFLWFNGFYFFLADWTHPPNF